MRIDPNHSSIVQLTVQQLGPLMRIEVVLLLLMEDDHSRRNLSTSCPFTRASLTPLDSFLLNFFTLQAHL